nr:hypothetical protein [uncultured Porphyromonas sp.]
MESVDICTYPFFASVQCLKWTATPPFSTTWRTDNPPPHDLLHPALRHTSLPYHQHLPYSTLLYDLYLPYSTQPYYRPHCITTYTRPTPLLGYLS